MEFDESLSIGINVDCFLGVGDWIDRKRLNFGFIEGYFMNQGVEEVLKLLIGCV